MQFSDFSLQIRQRGSRNWRLRLLMHGQVPSPDKQKRRDNMNLVNLPAEHYKAIVEALQRTWDVIGLDILNADGRDWVWRSHVIEVSIDCIRSHGGMSPETVDFYEMLSYYQKKKLGKIAFPDRQYGR